jgi:replicative DNA helicase
MPESLDATTRQLPQDIGAERAVLGAVLLNPHLIGQCLEEGLGEGDFFRAPHRLLFTCFVELHRDHVPVDLVTVTGRLEAQGRLDDIGGFSYLAGLPSAIPTLANLAHYVKVIRERATLRRLLERSAEIEHAIFDGTRPPEEILEQAERAIFELSEQRGTRRLIAMSEIVQPVFEQLRQRAENPDDVTGLPTGFRDLDRRIGGLQKTDLVIVAARPAMGKTAFALNIVARAALDSNQPVAVFSLEMGKEQLAARLLAAEARVLAQRMKTGRLTQDDWPALIEASERLYQAPIYLDDTGGVTLAEVWSKCRRRQAESGLGLVVIDYLQLMGAEDRNAPREQQISAISRGLKKLAKELRIPVVALSQLNRGVEARADKRPMMSDLRESGAIEQDADVIMFLYRDEVYNPNTDRKGIAEVLVRKQRHGEIGDVHLFWRGEFTRFENLAHNQDWGP